MRIVRNEIVLPTGGRVALHHLTDMHLGAPDVDETALRERVRLIAEDPHARATIGGDQGDLIRHNDRRYTPTELSPRYRQATDIRLATLEHAQEILDPIKDKIVGFADGNHERKLDTHFGGHFGVELAVNLGVERTFVDYRGFVHIQILDGPPEARGAGGKRGLGQLIDLQHGWQAGRSRGAAANQAEKEFSMTDADIILRGHSHKPDNETYMTLSVNSHRTKVRLKPRTWINGGTWRTGYRDNLAPIDREKMSEVERSQWAETKGFRIERVGGPVLLIGRERIQRQDGPEKTQDIFVTHTVVDGDINEKTLGL